MSLPARMPRLIDKHNEQAEKVRGSLEKKDVKKEIEVKKVSSKITKRLAGNKR